MTIEQPLVEYKKRDSSKPKPPSKGNHTRGRENKWSKSYSTTNKISSKTSSGKEGKDNNKWKEFTLRTNYFLCNGPHRARDCPKCKAFNSMIEEKKSKSNAHVRTMQLPNDLKTKLVLKTP